VEDEGYIQKWHFAIENQTKPISEAKQSRVKVTIETRVRPIDCWQIRWPSVSCNLRGQGHVYCYRHTRVSEIITQQQIALETSNLVKGLTIWPAM